MPLGINFGLRAGASRAVYDAPFVFFDAAPRRDWRLVARATLGNRKIRVLGLSPQIGFSWTRIESTIGFYDARSEEHTSELQSLMRHSYAVFCLKKKKTNKHTKNSTNA